MGKRVLLNLTLLVILGVLVALAVYQPGKPPPPAPTPLTTLNPATVNHIHIQQPHGPTIVLTRQDHRWLLTAPLHIRADAGRIHALLRLLTTPVHAHFTLGKHPPADYGLAPPRATVVFNHTTLAIGGSEPISHQRYIRQGDTVSLITDSMSYYLLARPTAFIDLALLGPDAQPVAFTLPKVSLKQVKGQWQSKPAKALRSADAVNALIDNWRNSQALEVRPYTATPADSTPISVTLDGVSEPLRFDVVHTRDGVLFVRRDLGLAWRLPPAAAHTLLTLPTASSAQPTAAQASGPPTPPLLPATRPHAQPAH